MSENYTEDAREVEPITNYEDTDESFEQFYSDVYDHTGKPQTFDVDPDSDDDIDWDELDRIDDDEAARDKAESWFKFAYGYTGYGDGIARASASPGVDLSGQTIVFKLPGWFAQDELGEWTVWWFGTLEVAKEDDGEWTAMCLSAIEPMSDRNEESYFRNPREEEWIPFSLVDFAFAVTSEVSDSNLIFDRGLDSSTIDHERGEPGDADIEIRHSTRTKYGEKFVIDSPYDTKDDLKSLDWDRFHANWSGDNWQFDVDALWPFIEEMTLQGWSVCVSEAVERETTDDSLAEGPYLPAEAKRGDA